MADRTELSTAQLLAVAKLSGTIDQLVLAAGRHADTDTVAQLHEDSRDPIVLGEVLGAVIARAEHLPALQPAIEMLRAAGADAQVAAAKAAWLRERYPNGLL